MNRDTKPQTAIHNTPELQSPVIRELSIQRFRGIKDLSWRPSIGVNLLLGGGDAGKTTLLEAIALVLSPSNSTVLSESDYWQCDVRSGFLIEAAIATPLGSPVLVDLHSTAWPWIWNGSEVVLPDLAKPTGTEEPVIKVRVSGSPDFELEYHIIQPNGKCEYLPAGIRRALGLLWLEGDERSDRDLRLVYGSALDQLLSDKTLRARIASNFANVEVSEQLSPDAKENLGELDRRFGQRGLPEKLDLGFTGGKRVSLNALIGLTSNQTGQKIPLSSWGAGTRRLAALEISSANQSGTAITVVDEVERGLEPYRQRVLLESIAVGGAQAFVTTHSPTVVQSEHVATIWYIDADGCIGKLGVTASAHARQTPETFLSRITLVCEGASEVGFLHNLLSRALNYRLIELGVCLTDGKGHDKSLALLEDLSDSNLKFGGFVDDEGRFPTRWSNLKTVLGSLLFQWQHGCLEQNIIQHVKDEDLPALVVDCDGDSGERRRTLQERLRTETKEWDDLGKDLMKLRATILDACIGRVPPGTSEDDRKRFTSHASRWFKTKRGGYELADKVINLGVWPHIKQQVLPFLNAVRGACSLDPIDDIA